MQILIIIIVNLIVFYKTFFYGFVSDDLTTYRITEKEDKDFTKKAKITEKLWWYRQWRQFRGANYWSAKSTHIQTTIIHILNCIGIYLVFGANDISLIASLLFAVNPINSQISIWVSGKGYGSATVLALLIFLFPLIAPITYILTGLFSVNALFAPLAFIGTKYWYMSFSVVFALFISLRYMKAKMISTSNNRMQSIAWKKFIPFFRTYGYYFLICLVPYKVAFYHKFLWGLGVNENYDKTHYKFDKYFWLGAFIFFVVITNMLWNFNNGVYGLWWFTANIIMWCNFVTIQQQISDRYIYTANIGLMVMISNMFMGLPYPYNYLVVSMIFTAYLTKLLSIMPMYRNEFWLNEYAITEDKECHYGWISRGIKKFQMKDYSGAYYDFNEALYYNQLEFKCHFNIANMFIMQGQVEAAKKHLKLANDCCYEAKDGGPMIAQVEELNRAYEAVKEIEEKKQIDLKKIKVYI